MKTNAIQNLSDSIAEQQTQPKFYTREGKLLVETTLEQASRAMSALRHRAMANGMSPDDVILPKLYNENGRVAARVSWNGRVWTGIRFDVCVYVPTDSDMAVGQNNGGAVTV